jgi:hypothetical protein
MAKAGLVEDQIALRIGSDKNQLRRRYIDEIKEGRAQARSEAESAESEKLSATEEGMRRAMFAGYGTHWENEDGTNDAQGGRTLAETEKLWSEWLRRHRRR